MRLLLVVFCCCFLQPLFCQNPSSYYIVFSARAPRLKPFSIGGHAFISWGRGTRDTAVAISDTYGFFPGSSGQLITAFLQYYPGRVVSGYKSNSSGQRTKKMVVEVDSASWAQTRAKAEAWNGMGYNLIYNNCTDYVVYVADAIGLKTPSTANIWGFPRKPTVFIKKLWRKNKKRSVKVPYLYFEKEKVRTEDLLAE